MSDGVTLVAGGLTPVSRAPSRSLRGAAPELTHAGRVDPRDSTRTFSAVWVRRRDDAEWRRLAQPVVPLHAHYALRGAVNPPPPKCKLRLHNLDRYCGTQAKCAKRGGKLCKRHERSSYRKHSFRDSLRRYFDGIIPKYGAYRTQILSPPFTCPTIE